MDERALRDVLHSAAAGADLPERFRRPSSLVRTAQTRRSLWWRRTGMMAAAVAAICTLTLVLSPAARTLAGDAIKGLVSIWQGQVDGKPADVFWLHPTAKEELIQNGQLDYSVDLITYHTMNEAAAAVGFWPAEIKGGDAELSEVRVEMRAQGMTNRSVFVVATYLVKDRSVSLATESAEVRTGDGWKPAAYPTMNVGILSGASPINVRPLHVGGHEVLAYDQPFESGLMWLQDDDTLRVRLTGPDAKLLELIAPLAMR